jgi:small conductance mechanosensitive channel
MEEQLLLNPESGWQQIQGKLTSWYENILVYLPNILLAVFTVVIFLLLGRFVSRLVRRLSLKLKLSGELSGLLGTIGYLVIGGIGLFAALGIMNLNKTVTSLLAGAGIIGLFLSLAFQNVAINVISGAIISMRRPIAVGDVIESNDFFGTVAYINWRTTHVITFQGQYVHIPNKEMIEQPVANYTKYGIRRVEFTMRISYDTNPEYVREVALKGLEDVPTRLKAYEPEFYFEEFEADALKARARFWIAYARDTHRRNYMEALHQGIVHLRNAFKSSGITLPYHHYRVSLNPENTSHSPSDFVVSNQTGYTPKTDQSSEDSDS